MFVNISNHPSENWCEKQRAAALDLGRELKDIPFPSVPPEWTTSQVSCLADEIVSQLTKSTTHAMVSGEFVLTNALVARMQRKGIKCYAATSTRSVFFNESGEKVSVFQFVQFREYPVYCGEQH